MPDDIPESWIRALRRRSGMSQADFARHLGVRQQTISEWETGRYAPRGASLTVLRQFEEEVAPYDASPPDPPPQPHAESDAPAPGDESSP